MGVRKMKYHGSCCARGTKAFLEEYVGFVLLYDFGRKTRCPAAGQRGLHLTAIVVTPYGTYPRSFFGMMLIVAQAFVDPSAAKAITMRKERCILCCSVADLSARAAGFRA